ncbi:hypothetical protein PR048_027000 [Dryococelus australis]|uniref:Uncharacterized protein n=1 Tax=Dryococelus australis TaxID=614101 RepID=A0ABQ9GMV5_9NEOP|nr:hypothetical protein PR048_027000 [Dryococelus australis]
MARSCEADSGETPASHSNIWPKTYDTAVANKKHCLPHGARDNRATTLQAEELLSPRLGEIWRNLKAVLLRGTHYVASRTRPCVRVNFVQPGNALHCSRQHFCLSIFGAGSVVPDKGRVVVAAWEITQLCVCGWRHCSSTARRRVSHITEPAISLSPLKTVKCNETLQTHRVAGEHRGKPPALVNVRHVSSPMNQVGIDIGSPVLENRLESCVLTLPPHCASQVVVGRWGQVHGFGRCESPKKRENTLISGGKRFVAVRHTFFRRRISFSFGTARLEGVGSLPDFRLFLRGFSRGSPIPPGIAFQRRSILGSHLMSCPVMRGTYEGPGCKARLSESVASPWVLPNGKRNIHPLRHFARDSKRTDQMGREFCLCMRAEGEIITAEGRGTDSTASGVTSSIAITKEKTLLDRVSEEIWVAHSSEVLRADEGDLRWKREIPEKTRRPMASSGTIPICENPVTRPGIEPGSHWWEVRGLTARPPNNDMDINIHSAADELLEIASSLVAVTVGSRYGVKKRRGPRWLDYLPPILPNQVRFPAGSHVGIVPDNTEGRWGFFFFWDLSFPFHSDDAPHSPRSTLIGSQHRDVKIRPNIVTRSYSLLQKNGALREWVLLMVLAYYYPLAATCEMNTRRAEDRKWWEP